MTQVTVKELAQVVDTPVERLLQQMREAGLPHTSAEQVVTDNEKQALLAHLKSSHGEKLEEPRKITLQRKTTTTLKVAGSKTISVEVRKKKTYVKRSPAEIEAEKQGYADEDFGRSGRKAAEKRLREELLKELEGKAERSAGMLDSEATDQLEAALGDLQGELDAVVNRVTAEALKAKAAQLGEIKQISEDAQSGNMTIVLEV